MPPRSTTVEPQAPRRGRPPIEAVDYDASDEENNKKLRMRQAQRTYRARKEKALRSERARAERLSRALDEAMATFTKLHRRVLQFQNIQNSPELLLSLNEAATEMTTIAHEAHKLDHFSSLSDTSSPSTHQQSRLGVCMSSDTTPRRDAFSEGIGSTKDSISHQPSVLASEVVALSLRMDRSGTTISERMVRACVERVVSILAGGSYDRISPPTLSIPLQLLGMEGLRTNALRLSRINLAVADFQYPPHSIARLPQMYRVVEGESNFVPRLPAPSVQQIIRGKTRTILTTNITSLQGEWLEAMDVEEYLEERGIYLPIVNQNGTMSQKENRPRYYAIAPEQTDSLQGKQIFSINTYLDPVAQSLVAGLDQETQQPPNENDRDVSMASSVYLNRHEPADYSIFGIPLSQPLRNSALSRMTSVRGLVPIDTSNLAWPDPSLSSCQDLQVPGPTLQITIDIDKLVQLLAANARCLGPIPGIRKAAVDYSIRESVVRF
ncbi:uncharacterized protein PGRI_035880 [Penicillium griseofulvum]|uniref:BZIP domain-containing protein n=1 Tax=Penicillium patulum TaxID=5078 RepID=A0A135LD11_PENPA|nr:uncharacterized protein PGRI_035880 [Penicillium griseofulvum]KXG46842.1 hypothetical protein PGRI_035880 [Penicillium griseofulvum]